VSGVRELRNSIIRSNFGVAGLRAYRQLHKRRVQIIGQLNHLRRHVAALAVRPEHALVRWFKSQRVGLVIRALEKELGKITLHQLSLINPRYAVKPAAVLRWFDLGKRAFYLWKLRRMAKRAAKGPRRLDP
jgi:hypothetical protein